MKMHRCPHCGEKTFTEFQWFAMKYRPHTSKRHVNGMYQIPMFRCSTCGKSSIFKNFAKKSVVLQTILTVVGIALIVVSLLFLDKYYKPLALLIAAVWIVLYMFLALKDQSFVPCEPDGHGGVRYILSLPNASFTVSDNKHIKPYGVYGLKFETETDDTKFKETFPDGMVPAVFHPTSEGSLTYDVRIIKPEFVPEAVLFPGAKFLVEDYDGIFIAKGTVNKVNLDDTDEE